jgi:hypothetical protein
MNDDGMLLIRALALSLSTELRIPFYDRLAVFSLGVSRAILVMPSHRRIAHRA